MEDPDTLEGLVEFFKAMADTNRLRIVGLLAQQPYSGEQLAAMLKLGPSTISHHLSRLAAAGLVSARAEGYYSMYQLERGVLEDMARRLLSKETLPKIAGGVDLDSYDQKVVAHYSLPDGRLKTIPSQRKKLLVVLRHIAHSFQMGERYPEKKVNEILKHFHEDTAFLRRELVGSEFMAREGGGGAYWRLEEQSLAEHKKDG